MTINLRLSQIFFDEHLLPHQCCIVLLLAFILGLFVFLISGIEFYRLIIFLRSSGELPHLHVIFDVVVTILFDYPFLRSH